MYTEDDFSAEALAHLDIYVAKAKSLNMDVVLGLVPCPKSFVS
jgi:hypothetical protein